MRAFLLCLTIAVTAADLAAGADELTVKEITVARKVYVAKCAKCHQFYDPAKYSGEQWSKWMDKMGRKSKLKPEQEALLNRYLDAYRAGRLPGKPQAK